MDNNNINVNKNGLILKKDGIEERISEIESEIEEKRNNKINGLLNKNVNGMRIGGLMKSINDISKLFGKDITDEQRTALEAVKLQMEQRLEALKNGIKGGGRASARLRNRNGNGNGEEKEQGQEQAQEQEQGQGHVCFVLNNIL